MFNEYRDGFFPRADALMVNPLTVADILDTHQSKYSQYGTFFVDHWRSVPDEAPFRNAHALDWLKVASLSLRFLIQHWHEPI